MEVTLNPWVISFSIALNTVKQGKPSLKSIDKILLNQNKSSLTNLLLYSDRKRNSYVNAFILNSATEFIVSSGRFNGPLFNGAQKVFFFL